MTLNFGGDLFKGDPEDSLKARWQQSSSSLKNYTHDMTASGTIATVTAGKRLYVSSILVGSAKGGDWSIKDNATTVIKWVNSADYLNTPLSFDPPLYFDTSIVYTEDSPVTYGLLTITGWEE